MEDSNQSLQEEECLALSSIYGRDFHQDPHLPDSADITLHLAPGPVILRCHFPTTYPSDEPPYYELVAEWHNRAGVAHGISESVRKKVDERLLDLFVPGQVVVFEWIASLQEILEEAYGREDEREPDEPQSPPASIQTTPLVHKPPSPISEPSEDGDTTFPMTLPPDCPPITHSVNPVIDRKSIFIAHVAPIVSPADAATVVQALLSNKRIMRATHNISAYRIVENNGVVRQDCDDDGETAAGGRLLHMLQLADVRGAVVVVSRWYGGIQLGPARFKHINNVARTLLEHCGFIQSGSDMRGKGKSGKKR
ncbi:uncharacterized protein SPPG_02682 [Spizellomyces punctatus DAOM BR117]|uniref:RWD domain-containing protein n=1 Tax=Spizellomyces punctatus (strain DAOM BR117) TaxID=645134 RepID=A0A0L0HMP8_SPIPD|nr:uncharacterized protein SPPG_02682 [Spizellomyces punctatus DAOM BR117]KND02195.1 hypothetical protein SPPG_02682 [Spizellomyces punctatus DAOM BR117]|eukprot:XP_016610234.1 hypothetical protein SPPG_02682 [Spizellomyces punctatus DAOM BR117]